MNSSSKRRVREILSDDETDLPYLPILNDVSGHTMCVTKTFRTKDCLAKRRLNFLLAGGLNAQKLGVASVLRVVVEIAEQL